jgi:hypothetical protein
VIAILRQMSWRLIVRPLRVVGCFVIVVGCLYVCLRFSQVVESRYPTATDSSHGELVRLVNLQIDDLFSRNWTVDGAEWDWQLSSTTPQDVSTNADLLELDLRSFPVSVFNCLTGHINSQTVISHMDSDVTEDRFAVQDSIFTIRRHQRGEKQVLDECSIWFQGSNSNTDGTDGKTLVFRRKTESTQEQASLLPIPETFDRVISQRSDNGELLSNLVVRREGSEALLKFWTECGYFVKLIVRPELPPETYLVMKNETTLLVWNPSHSNSQGLALIRKIPTELGNLIVSTSD